MTARIGAPKTGGRRRGSLDRGERQLVTAEMAGDILAVYKKLGGVKWLLEFAKANPGEFLRQGLSRLFPAAPKDEADIQLNQQFNIGNLTDRDAAMRVAFALNSAMHGDPSIVVERELAPEMTPQEASNQWTPPTDAPDMPEPTCEAPVEDPAKQRWIEELPLTPEQRRDNAVIRETHEASIENYHGSGAEQGLGPTQRQRPAESRTVNDLHKRMRNRRDELL